MPLSSRLTALRQILETHTAVMIRIGRPDNAPGLFIWPWRLEEDARVRNALSGMSIKFAGGSDADDSELAALTAYAGELQKQLKLKL